MVINIDLVVTVMFGDENAVRVVDEYRTATHAIVESEWKVDVEWECRK